MKAFQFNKLVRDKIPTAIKNRGGVVAARKLNRREYIKELIKKINEEAAELGRNLSPVEVAEELADIAEVVAALQKVFKVSDSKLRSIRQKKIAKTALSINVYLLTASKSPIPTPGSTTTAKIQINIKR